MEVGNDKLSIFQITCSVRSSPIPRLSALRKDLYQTSLKRATTPATIEFPITITDGVQQERSIL